MSSAPTPAPGRWASATSPAATREHLSRAATGTLQALAAATCFAFAAILGKLAYGAGLQPVQLLAYRFGLAAAGLAVIAVAAGQNPLAIGRRRLAGLALLGGAGYATQAITFFTALATLPASLVELILYTFPAITAVAALVFLKRPITRIQAVALLASFAGVALLVGGRVQLASGPGLLFAVASPLLLAAYVLVGERVMAGIPALSGSAVSMAATAVVYAVAAGATGHLQLPYSPRAWLVVVAIAVIPTMIAITLFLAALSRIDGGRVALLSTWEPVVTVTLAVVVLGDRLGAAQVAGAALVLAAVIALQWPARAAGRLRARPRPR